MDEHALLGAACNDRKSYETLVQLGCRPNEFGEAGKVVYECVGEQYRRDGELKKADHDLLRVQVERKYGKGSLSESIIDFAQGLPRDTSGVNVTSEYRLLRLSATSTELATLLASGNHGDETRDAIERYRGLVSGEAGEDFKERLEYEDFTEEAGERIPLFPSNINRVINGGAHRGNNITVYGRPNSAKTMFGLNNAACMIKNGYKVLYVANEEPPMDITRRLLARLSKIDIDLLEDGDLLKAAFTAANPEYGSNWILLHKANCTYQDIRRAAARIRPDVIIVDQLKNIHVAEDNRALQLDKLARQVRELGIEFNALTISVTQAGESAEGKLVLGQTDVEWSNTGIPGAADLMIGIGVNDEFNASNKRMISISKNKLKNWHGAFPVWIDPQRTWISGKAL